MIESRRAGSIRTAPVRLLAGLVLGLAAGMFLPRKILAVLLPATGPVGRLWLDAMTMTVVPLLFGLLVTGVATASRRAQAGASMAKIFLRFAIILTLASLASTALSEAALRLWPLPPSTTGLGAVAAAALPVSSSGPWYDAIIPANPVRAAADMAIIPLLSFALFLGFALARLEQTAAETLLAPLKALADAMLIVVGWVLFLGPLGVFSLATNAAAHLGVEALAALARYLVIVCSACLSATSVAYMLIALAGGLPLARFARAALPAQTVAVGTQSSLACLPVMIEATSRLGLEGQSARITLPLAVALFRTASVAANVAVAVFLAHLHGISLHGPDFLLLPLVAVPVSLAAVGLPAQISFFATIAPVCLAVGVPVTNLPLLLAIEAVPDIFRTLGNVTNDLAVACIMSARSGRDPPDQSDDLTLI